MPIPLTPPAIVGAAEVCPQKDDEMKLTDDLRHEYENRFASILVKKSAQNPLAVVVPKILRGQDRYKLVAADLGVPWFVIALIHQLECDGDWTCHLHNGDSLEGRTINVPRNRPVTGLPPFTWEASARDAIVYEHQKHGWDNDWSVAGILFKLEGYNGFGYRVKDVPTPYLWSGSQFYVNGKFVRDGVFDRQAVSTQLGAAVILRRLADLKLVDLGSASGVSANCE